ncbi:unnamed protein product, partial [Prorocentrum cordatum]
SSQFISRRITLLAHAAFAQLLQIAWRRLRVKMVGLTFARTALMIVGVTLMNILSVMGPGSCLAAWGWVAAGKEAPELTQKMAEAVWSCIEPLVGVDGAMSDKYRKENDLKYGDEALNEWFLEKTKCHVKPNEGYTCDIAETSLVGEPIEGVHKSLKANELIKGAALGPQCTNTGYPGAAIDCQLVWEKEPACTKREGAEGQQEKKGAQCCCMQ